MKTTSASYLTMACSLLVSVLSACSGGPTPAAKTPEIQRFDVDLAHEVVGTPVTFSWEVLAEGASFTCTLDVNGNGTPEYEFGDCTGPSTSALQASGSQQHTYTEAGTYTAVLTVSDDQGADASESVEVTMRESENVPPTVAEIEDQTVIRNTVAPRSIEIVLHIEDPDDDSFDVTIASGDEAVIPSTTSTCGTEPCALTLTPSPDETAQVALQVTVSDGRGGEAATSFVVNVRPRLVQNVADSGAGSLRQTLHDAEPGDVIGFDGGGPFASLQIIRLEDQIRFEKDVTIEGPGADGLRLSGQDTTRVFEVAGDVTVVIAGLTLADGHAPRDKDLFGVDESVGGGVVIDPGGTLTLIGSRVISNRADHRGGGVANLGGTLTVGEGSTIAGNEATVGGGIWGGRASMDGPEPTTVIDGSTISDNTAFGGQPGGGGISHVTGRVDLRNGSVLRNRATQGNGGGIYLQVATLILQRDSLVFANAAANRGGGIYALGASSLVVVNGSRIESNVADLHGGGIFNRGGTISLDEQSLVSMNVASAGADTDHGIGGGIYDDDGTLEGIIVCGLLEPDGNVCSNTPDDVAP